MKRLVIVLNLVLLINISYAQKEKDVYFPKNDVVVDNILKRFDAAKRSCGVNLFSVGKHAELIISEVIDENTVVIVLSHNSSGENMAEIKKFYCIKKSDLETYFKKKSKPEIGILTVPFKLRFSPIKVMAGNTLGPYIGKSFSHKNGTSSTLLAFASLTNVSLNDLNNEVPDTKWGVGFGGGYVWKITETFHTGIITGIDLFEGVESWPYKFQPWLSVSIGFSFTSSRKEEKLLKIAN